MTKAIALLAGDGVARGARRRLDRLTHVPPPEMFEQLKKRLQIGEP